MSFHATLLGLKISKAVATGHLLEAVDNDPYDAHNYKHDFTF